MLMHAITHRWLYRDNKRVCTESWLWEKNPQPDPSLIHHSHVFLGSQWKDDKAPAADECSLSGPWAAAGARGWRLPDRHQEPSTASQRCRTTAVQGLCCTKFISLCLQPFLCFASCKSHGCEGVLGDGWCTWSRKESFSSLSFVVINVFCYAGKDNVSEWVLPTWGVEGLLAVYAMGLEGEKKHAYSSRCMSQILCKTNVMISTFVMCKSWNALFLCVWQTLFWCGGIQCGPS